MSELHTLSTPERVSETSFRWNVPDGWQQGRGAFGGLVLAAMTRAMMACEEESARLPRTLTAELMGPTMVGDAEIAVEVLRRGNALTVLDARVKQGDEIRARASLLLGRKRTEMKRRRLPTPDFSPAADSLPIAPAGPPLGPTFSQHLAVRPIAGIPLSGQPPEIKAWLGWRNAPAVLGAPELVAYADALWPSGLTEEKKPRPIATVSFELQWFHHGEGLDPKVPLWYQSSTIAAEDGYVCEDRQLWSPAGELLLLNRQNIAWI